MGILEKLGRIKKVVLKSHGLKKTFNSLLFDIENIKGSMRLSNIFELIGETLQKNKINSIVCVINAKRNDIVVRNVNFPGEFEKIITTESVKKIGFQKFTKYQEVINKKEVIFCSNRIAQLKKIFKDSAGIQNIVGETNSMIAPLVLKGEIIGTLEILSPTLEKKDLAAVDDFVKKLVANITNNILFYEIRESEKRYRNLFQNSSDGLVFFSLREKKFKESNLAMKKISGYTAEELQQIHHLNLFLKDDKKRIEGMISYIKNNKNPENLPIKLCTKIQTKYNEIKICDIEIGLHSDKEEIYFSFYDVTNQKNIETALRESEEKYRMLVDNAEDGVIVFNAEGKITFVNRGAANIVGGNKKDLLDKNVFTFVSPEDLEMVMKRNKDRLAGKSVVSNYDFRIITLSGEKKYINYSGNLIEKKGKIVGIQAIIRDISKGKELQELIFSTKRHYVSIIDSIQDDIVVISEDYKIVSVNRSFAKNVGLNYQDIKGKDCSQIMPKFRNGVLKSHCFVGNCRDNCVFLNVFKDGMPSYFVEKSIVDNVAVYFGVGVFPVKNNDKTYQVVITIRDISDSKRAEDENMRLTEFNQKILDSSPVSIVVLDKKGKIILSNGMAKRLLDDRENRLYGRSLVDTGAIKDNEELKGKYKKLLENGESFYYDNLSYISRKNGQKNYLNIIAVPLYDKDKNVDGAISMAIDNTEKVIAKQKLLNLNRELEQKVARRTVQLDKINKELSKVLELKSKFISDASHELRTPLTVIQGNLDLAKQEYVSMKDEIPEAFTLIGKEVEQMTSILADLTMLTNTDASSETINYDNVDVNLLGTAVVQTLKVLAKQKKLDLKFINEDDDIEIIGDETKLEKLLLNLVRNAIKYTEEGGNIEVRTKKDGNFVKIIVKDDGIGIPENDLPYIFERFYRVDKARSRKEGGTGLGLSICKWIAEAHGGSIIVESKLEVGTTFTVELPIDCRNFENKK